MCLLTSLPFHPFPLLVIHSLFPAMPQISLLEAVTTSRFTCFDWAGHAQSILEEVREKLSDITLALTKRCECPDRGNDTGHIRLNDNQRSSSPFIPAWHWLTWVCGHTCILFVSDIKRQSEWKRRKERGKRRRRRRVREGETQAEQ